MNPQSNDSPVSGQFSFKRKYEDDDKPGGNGSNTSDSEDNHSQEKVLTSSPDPVIDHTKKPSPTNQRLMSDLKTVKIDRSQYRHYGHQSSMTSQSLEQIISEGKRKEEEEAEAKKKLIKDEDKKSEEKEKVKDTETKGDKEIFPELKLEKEKSKDIEPISTIVSDTPATASTAVSAVPSSNSSGVQLSIADLLNINSNQPLPYSIDTIHEIIKLKTEQEITKQIEIKNELAHSTLELLKYAQNLKISPELIPILFVGNNAVNEVKANLQRLQVDPQAMMKQIEDQARKSAGSSGISSRREKRHEKTSSLPSISDMGKPSTYKIGQPGATTRVPSTTHSSLVSPLRSPNRSPDLTHKKYKSDASETSPYLSNTKPVLLPLPGSNYQNSSHPQQQLQSHPQLSPMQYPLYYNSPPGPGVDSKYLGSPYSQKQSQSATKSQQSSPPQRNLYPQQQQASQQHLQHAHQQPQYYYSQKQPPQYQYYMATTPPQGPQYIMRQVPMGGQYPPAMAAQVAPDAVGPGGAVTSGSVTHSGPSAAPNTESEKNKVPGGGSILRFDKAEPEDQPPTKKAKSIPKTSGINFMISTPENPPAKKYNNSRS
ncbi:hypothetical protein CLIB1423_01S10154 [[Candida] railenensis]|uniref:Uncharacterized protein n=1 Tax=[Candida] railenensis TaxID=45579 RepID=A0A9P0QKQ2_9ASCO|nr:hypothetical protein CLIB1423_01S10154 [[Candida] railenensis]